ncbi:MAG: thermonuclease family protein [Bacteriovoracaceae bacterium]|jgi:endonuclease YncB( thermonuclease family)|nr:thermonuclease family protein [Bacteriovoracaceae bacterium]
MKILIVLLLSGLCLAQSNRNVVSGNGYYQGRCVHNKNTFRCVKYVDNYDADTITVNIPKVHDFIGKNVSVRVNGVDTPEVATLDSCEKAKGRTAKKLVKNLLKNAKRIDLLNIQRGKYFRIVADVIIDGKSLKDYLLKNKLAYEYYGGTKEEIDWCRGL